MTKEIRRHHKSEGTDNKLEENIRGYSFLSHVLNQKNSHRVHLISCIIHHKLETFPDIIKGNWRTVTKYTFKFSMYVIRQLRRTCLCNCLPNNKFRLLL